MQFHKKMYVGGGIKHPQKVQWKLKHGVGMVDIYVISLAHGSNQLECMHCSYFKQRIIRESIGVVVGLAKGYSEAQGLILSMVEDAVRETGTANVKEYLETGMSKHSDSE